MDSYFLELAEFVYSLFEVSREEPSSQGETEEDAPQNILLGERTSSENIKFQEIVKEQEEFEEKKCEEKENKTRLQKSSLSSLSDAFQVLSTNFMKENIDTIERLVHDLEKWTSVEPSLYLRNNILQATFLCRKKAVLIQIDEESFTRATKILHDLLRIIEDYNDIDDAIDSAMLVSDIIKTFGLNDKRGHLLIRTVENIFVLVVAECRKINGDDNSKSARGRRYLLYRVRDILILFSKELGSEFAPFLKSTYEKCLPYFPARFEDHECIFNVIVGLIADAAEHIGVAIIPFGAIFVPMFARFLDDSHPGVRHNASYGLGTMFAAAKGAFKEYYEIVLPSLFRIAEVSPTESDLLGARDNALSALAKMIASDPDELPFFEIAPKILNGLPLLEDHAEKECIFPALISVLERWPKFVEENHVIIGEKLNEALKDEENIPVHVREKIGNFMKSSNIPLML
jgi:hypothetical protein